MSIREFLRGGYREIDELTLITNHGRPYATWMPQTSAKKRAYPLSRKTDGSVDSRTSPHPEYGE